MTSRILAALVLTTALSLGAGRQAALAQDAGAPSQGGGAVVDTNPSGTNPSGDGGGHAGRGDTKAGNFSARRQSLNRQARHSHAEKLHHPRR